MTPTDGQSINDEPIDEQLMAYLDGELDSHACQRIERRLADDPDARDRLRDLQQSWDLLDHLPSARTDRSFTETTVEMVATRAAEDADAEQQQRFRRYAGKWAKWLGRVAAVLLLGYLISTLVASGLQDRYLRDLPLIENMDLYRHADSLSFIRGLDRDGLFAAEEVEESGTAADARIFTDFQLAAVRERAQRLDPTEKYRLQQNKEHFDRLDLQEKENMRKLHSALAADPQTDQLLRVLTEYRQWLGTLTQDERSQVRVLPEDKRLGLIAELKRRQTIEQFASLVAEELTRDDRFAIFGWFSDFVVDHEDEILKKLPDEERTRLAGMHEGKRRWLLGRAIFEQGFAETLPDLDDQELDKLRANLSPKARDLLQKAGEDDKAQVQTWMKAAWLSRSPRVDQDRLQRFYLELSLEKRAALEKLPPEQFEKKLKDLYLQQRMRRFGRDGRRVIIREDEQHHRRSGERHHRDRRPSPGDASEPSHERMPDEPRPSTSEAQKDSSDGQSSTTNGTSPETPCSAPASANPSDCSLS